MAKSQNNLQSQRFHYNFKSVGGAIGTFQMQIALPISSIVLGFWVDTIVTPTSAGAATLSFGIQTNDLAVPVTNAIALMGVTAINAFVAGQVIRGVDLNAKPFKCANTQALIMVVGTAALTAGELYGTIFYTENNF